MSHNRLFAILAAAAPSLFLACGSPPPPPAAKTPEPPKVAAMSPADNVAWYQGCWDQFNRKAWAEFRQCYGDSATSIQAGYGAGIVQGSQAIVASSEEFAKAFPDGLGTLELVLANGSHVASIAALTGTNSGPMTGPDGTAIPATNKSFSQYFGHMVEVGSDRKISREIGVQDTATMLHQLGLSKDPARGPVAVPTAPPTVVLAQGDETEAGNVEVLKQQIAAFNKHDLAGVESFEAPNFVMREMAAPADQDITQNREELTGLWKGFSDLKIDLTTVWGAGDYVVSTGTVSGTNDGDFAPMSLKKTGRSMNLPFLEIDKLSGGKLVESWLFYDGMAMAGQLMAPPAAAK